MQQHRIFYLLVGLGLLGLVGCSSPKTNQPPGIALSFDDRFINEWYQLRPLFRQYNAHVTFYITQFDSLSPTERAKLKVLQQEGHEIACHGAIHTNAVAYLKDHSLAQYMQAEVYPELQAMQRQGFNPTSFAFPGGAHTAAVDAELLKHFVMLRDVALVERTLWGITLHWPIRWMTSIYYRFDGDPITDGLLIDEGAGLSNEEIQTALDKAAQHGEALLLFGHKPYAGPVPADGYGFLTRRLAFILAECTRRNMRTYTMSELIRVSQANTP